ncbi:hypothetical protein [Celeribacter halophilus]|uniref:hypothetical protein n=1 Tax=Celeribacter halophilus TaxID=576117 RepID=UPI001C09E704|nr:hypothetical protein [Celeribacter halophilus]MBU2889019.1 hypothetical protein [Celeribacter halophilus]MDO6510452.1 hypothetical protein [Celeribacter halophilus]
MDWYEIHNFVDNDLPSIRSFLFEVLSLETKVGLYGLSVLFRHNDHLAPIQSLKKIETNLYALARAARFISHEHEHVLNNILTSSPLINRCTEISLAFELAKNQRPLHSPLSVITKSAAFFGQTIGINFNKFAFDENGSLPIRQMLVDLDRIIPIAQSIAKTYWRRISEDDEIFKPSGIDIEEVKRFIDSAIQAISESSDLDLVQREKLMEYLTEANSELAEGTPVWRKIVGALVIVSTVLAGLAAAPEALENVERAYRHILGTSMKINNSSPAAQIFLPPAVDV